MRGLFAVVLMVPLTLFNNYLVWSVVNEEGDNNWVTLFSYGGAVASSLIAGVGMGLLFAFQGVFIGSFSHHTLIGFQNGFFWSCIPLTYLWIHALD